ncbi:family 1 glycosylhydrolase [Deinococcus yavapaiensis]|uniref:Beta-glucosidase/6-phospho-beta-glucosidase/beta-galactosidase n=1 Tax=Deinococcus yavapaiensis KR-236 TaxID=694435 RepID=A0A318RZB0_9DEIO|nr:family 1 glycosylhydrolase [Deinococcus yavapaiensis]PYE49377.1 beta-glucosidase/6-phospho-beta-glucosidase/beta-galactosidase [Deinococcus yavapaiensis KR-236]
MTVRASLFPTFFLSGFECSTFHWKRQGRRDLVAETQHDRFVAQDYRLLRDLGIAVVREGVPWPLVDRGGEFDFGRLDPYIDALNACQLLPIWDLCHYGYPDDLDPFQPEFKERFARYCRAVAEYVTPRVRGPHFFTPINEITFFSFCGGEWGWVAPYGESRETRFALRLALCEAAIAGVHAIREVDPDARMVNVDPLVYIVPPADRPDLAEEARDETFRDTFVAWDVLAGKEHPEFGGSLDVLDIVGVNCYSFGQMEYREHGPHQALGPRDERIVPLGDLLWEVWERYKRPIIISETSGLGDGRPAWLCDVMEESLAAVSRGIDLHGVCLFPGVDMPNWHEGEWLHNGIHDLVPDGNELKRVPFGPYVDELRRWQKLLNRVTTLDADPFSDPVDLQDVKAAADRMKLHADRDWS